MTRDANRYTRGRERGGDGLYAKVVDSIGQEIVNGDLPEGGLIDPDEICEDFQVSRSVVREALRTLGSMGMVEARPRVGTRILPKARWDLFNPLIIAWRGRGNDYLIQQRELLELRKGVEGAAAALAAQRIEASTASEILARSAAMLSAAQDQDKRQFYDADIAFHRLILEGSGNTLMAKYADIVEALLRAKAVDPRPAMASLSLTTAGRHVALAKALLERDAESAETIVGEIVNATLAELDEVMTPPGERAAEDGETTGS